jgi:vacuolar-type H+-ATPase subunit D/Vma8
MRVTSSIASLTMLTVVDINSELDEMDREEFYRLKKVNKHKEPLWQG